MIKKYYRIKFRLTSAMNIGGNESDTTDKDVLRDARGIPFIPGSSLAGVYRSQFKAGNHKDDAINRVFGYIAKNTGNGNESYELESKIKIYDATACGDDAPIVSVRDCVALDEYKTARTGCKFDYEVVEPGAEFVTFIEMSTRFEDELLYLDAIAKLWSEGSIRLGGKTMRGLGRTEAVEIKCKRFDMSRNADEWLDFDMFDPSAKWEDADFSKDESLDRTGALLEEKEYVSITLNLELVGGISIRRYTTDGHYDDTNKTAGPDYSQYSYKREDNEIPFIPGTSWTGAFRKNISGYLSYCCNEDPAGILEAYFGRAGSVGKHQSRIGFGESEIKGAKGKIVTRNAIDRITGGAQSGSLYTEKTFYGGTTELEITIPAGPLSEIDENVRIDAHKKMVEAIAASVADLNSGYMAVGGLTAIGRGLFKVTHVSLSGKVKDEYDVNKDSAELYKWLVEKVLALLAA